MPSPVRRLTPAAYNTFLAVLVLVVAIGFIIVYRLKRDVEAEEGTVSDADLLKEFERAYYAGEMDEAEFQRVKARLGMPEPPPRPAPAPPADPPA